MARDNVDRLVVQMEATLRKFEKQMEQGRKVSSRTATQIERRMGKMDRSIQGATMRVAKNLKTAFALGGATAGLTALTRGVRTSIRSMAQLGAESERAGLGIEEFQEWSFVAEQNRIGLDAMVDSLKELNLRADEFIETGKGPAAEAFARMGYGAAELKRALEDPSELMLDIIARMQDLDRAAQIRVADEIFGGTGGEQFVQLLDQGADGIRRTMQEAREAGAVLDAELIQKAEELDRKFTALTTKASTFFKRIVAESAEAVSSFGNVQTEIDDLFRSMDQAQSILGGGIAEQLGNDTAAVEEHEQDIAALRQEYTALGDETRSLVGDLATMTAQVRDLGYDDVADELSAVWSELQEVTNAFQEGEIEADAFEDRVMDLASSAQEAFGALDQIDQVHFGNVITQVSAFIERLTTAASRARELRRSLPGATEDGGTTELRRGPPARRGPRNPNWRLDSASDLAPTRSLRPQAAPNDIDAGLPPLSSGGSGSGGGGSARAEISDYMQLVQRTREEIQKLELEAAELLAIAGTGQDYGDAMEYARTKADLLYEAQEAGRELTPELRAEIDQLAQSYVEAGQKAEEAAAKLEDMDDNAERGATRLADMFEAIRSGLMSAGEALQDLLMELVKIQIQKQILAAAGAAGGTGLGNALSALGGALSMPSFAGGGGTGNGPRSGGLDGKGGFPALLHPKETVIDHTKGGMPMAGRVEVEVYVNDDGTLGAIATRAGGVAAAKVMEQQGGKMVSHALVTGQADRAMASRFGQSSRARRA